MKELEYLLQDIPENERVEALQYYKDYFDDAGYENEQQVLAELESPVKVANNIKDGLKTTLDGTQKNNSFQKKENLPWWAIVLIVIGCIFGAPFIIAGAAVLFSLVVSVLAIVFSLVIGFGAVAIATLLSGILVTIIGLFHIFRSPFSGMIVMGGGMVCFATGILFMMITVLLCGYAVPGCFKGIAKGYRKIFKRKQSFSIC